MVPAAKLTKILPKRAYLTTGEWLFINSSPLRCFDRFSVSNLSFDLNLNQLFGKIAEPSLASQDTNASCSRKSYLQYKPRTSWGGKKQCSPRGRFDGIFQQNQVYLKTNNQTQISPTNPRKKTKKKLAKILSKRELFSGQNGIIFHQPRVFLKFLGISQNS